MSSASIKENLPKMEATKKALNVRVSQEIHQAAKILCAQKKITQTQLIEILIKQESSK